jgi:hypothetical protein
MGVFTTDEAILLIASRSHEGGWKKLSRPRTLWEKIEAADTGRHVPMVALS